MEILEAAALLYEAIVEDDGTIDGLERVMDSVERVEEEIRRIKEEYGSIDE